MAQGNIFMSLDYDPDDPPPANIQQMMSCQGAKSGPVWGPLSHHSTKANLHKRAKEHYVRTGTFTPESLISHDVGKFSICALGDSTSTGLAGYLYVTYNLKLNTPQINTSGN